LLSDAPLPLQVQKRGIENPNPMLERVTELVNRLMELLLEQKAHRHKKDDGSDSAMKGVSQLYTMSKC
jgi:hypothetical protein